MKIEEIQKTILNWLKKQKDGGEYVMIDDDTVIEDIDLTTNNFVTMDGSFDLNELAKSITSNVNKEKDNEEEDNKECLHKSEYLQYFKGKDRVICKKCGEVWENKSVQYNTPYLTNGDTGYPYQYNYPVTSGYPYQHNYPVTSDYPYQHNNPVTC